MEAAELGLEKIYGSGGVEGNGGGENFIVEELLDLSNDDDGIMNGDDEGVVTGNSADCCSTVSTVGGGGDSCNSSSFSVNDLSAGGGRGCFDIPGDGGGDLCVVPYDDQAELEWSEWMSSFLDESFSSEDIHKLNLISDIKSLHSTVDQQSETKPNLARNHQQTNISTSVDNNDNKPNPIFDSETTVPGKARSKRSRTAPCSWSSRLEVLSSPTLTTATTTTSTQMSSTIPEMASNMCLKPLSKPATKRVKATGDGAKMARNDAEGRRCLHCATDKTPQWRTGPMGPKTLCNACGVRFKSGRLVPEYRPAASPTFVMSKHSNSHRKVMELRRQKELIRQQRQYEQQQQLIQMFDGSDPDDYLIHHQIGPDFMQLL